MTRIRVCGTVDSALAREIDLEHEARIRQAKQLGSYKVPNYSDTLEALLKGGLRDGRKVGLVRDRRP
jgi:hypothetical protein